MDRRSALLLVALVSALLALFGASVYLSSAGDHGPRSTLPAPDMPEATFAGFIGDEVTAGPTDADKSNRWTSVVAASEGWSQFNVAQQATSYLVGDASVFRQAAALPPRDYRFVFISFTVDTPQLADKLAPAAADAALREIRRRYPDAEVIAVSPVAANLKSLKAAQTAGVILKSSAAKVGGRYIDVGQPLIQGSSTESLEPTVRSAQNSIATSILARLGGS